MNGKPDLNLLVTLDVLLSEGSVAGAARRLRLSPSAMSRAFARLRKTMGDPLLVRAGRKLVPTPRAARLKEKAAALVREIEEVLNPREGLDVKTITRTFTIRASDGFVENVGAGLIARIQAEAPGVKLRFEQKPIKESGSLREGEVDFEVGVIEQGTSPELKRCVLFKDRFVGVVRKGHPLSRGTVTTKRYAEATHISVSRRRFGSSLVEAALGEAGWQRKVVAIIPGFSGALAVVRRSDLVVTVPEAQTEPLRSDMFSFPLPFAMPAITVSLMWHPKFEADAAHVWLRERIRACGSTGSTGQWCTSSRWSCFD